jgi:hypothetical protein
MGFIHSKLIFLRILGGKDVGLGTKVWCQDKQKTPATCLLLTCIINCVLPAPASPHTSLGKHVLGVRKAVKEESDISESWDGKQETRENLIFPHEKPPRRSPSRSAMPVLIIAVPLLPRSKAVIIAGARDLDASRRNASSPSSMRWWLLRGGIRETG